MALFFELGIFALALAFGIWQIRDVAKERAKTAARRAQKEPAAQDTDSRT
jgi:ABC-type nickel/cobalt efflux system permease component RcnA